MKKNLILLVIAFALFYSGYHIGVRKNNEYTVKEMISLSNRFVASRAAISINALNDIRSITTGNNIATCKIRAEVIRLAQDWRKCKSSKECSEKIMNGRDGSIDKIIDDFEKNIMPIS